MKILMTATVLASTLLWDVAYASSEQLLTCKTGFFSERTFIIKIDKLLLLDNLSLDESLDLLMEPTDGSDYKPQISPQYQKTRLLSGSRKSLNTYSRYYLDQSHPRWAFQTFKWQEGDLKYQLWDSSTGWAINIIEKDWSSTEGNHYDTVLDNTYCRESD